MVAYKNIAHAMRGYKIVDPISPLVHPHGK